MKNSLAAVVAVLVLAGHLLIGVEAASTSDCVSQVSEASGLIQEPGGRLPVILVHGWLSSSSVWDNLAAGVENSGLAEQVALSRFDYSHAAEQWVTHDDIGPLLGQWIDCLADVSAQQGGLGKVALVGHSMGGLAIRHAVDESVDRAARVAFVATLGTPNEGSHLARSTQSGVLGYVLDNINSPNILELLGTNPAKRAMQPGSVELGSLALLSDSFPTYAGAGDVIVEGRLLFFTASQPIGDIIVGKQSATSAARFAESGPRLGGEDVMTCPVVLDANLPVLGSFVGATATAALVRYQLDLYASRCFHTALPQDKYFIDSITAQIAALSSDLSRPPEDHVLAEAIGCPSCVVTGRIEFDHPTWGATTLVSLDGDDSGPLKAGLVAVAGSRIEWTWSTDDDWGGLYSLEPAEQPMDGLGRIFLIWNPGRHNGTMILEPVEEGFDDFGTAPGSGDRFTGEGGGQLFYYTEPVDRDGDGVFEILQYYHHADCWITDGILHCGDEVYAWDGDEYALASPVTRVDFNDPRSVAEAFLTEWVAGRDGGMIRLIGPGAGGWEYMSYLAQNPPQPTELECDHPLSTWNCGPAGVDQWPFVIYVADYEGDGKFIVDSVLSP